MSDRQGNVLAYVKGSSQTEWIEPLLAPVMGGASSIILQTSWGKFRATLSSQTVRCCLVFLSEEDDIDHILKDLKIVYGDSALPVVFIESLPSLPLHGYKKNIHFEILQKKDLTSVNIISAIAAAERVYEVCVNVQTSVSHDTLTGLISRELLINRLELSLLRCNRYGERCALLFINVNQFKSINEKYGHTLGDKLLVEMAQRLEKNCRSTDSIARINGDEFVVLIENSDKNIGRKVADKLQKSLSIHYEISRHKIDVTLSMGMANYPDTAQNAQELLKQAGQALTKAKDDVDVHFVNFSEQHKSQFYRRNILEMELEKTIKNGDLNLVYQPIVCASTHEVKRLEALSRWPHAEFNISPIELIEMVDRLNLSEAFHEWLFFTAFKQLDLWQKESVCPDLCLNIPANYCYSNVISDTVLKHIEEFKIDPKKVELEITESTLMRYPERSIKVLNYLHDVGLKIAVDDFGTGFSCMSYLTTLPIDTLKIDRDFFLVQTNKERNKKVIEAITALGHSLDLEIIAEGVETDVQLALAKGVGCDLLQGYYFGRPQAPGSNWTEYTSKYQHLSNQTP